MKKSGNGNKDLERIKDRQKALIYRQIFNTPDTTRSTIVSNNKIRPTTVSLLVQEMIDDDIILEGSVRNAGTKGRPERYLKVNYNKYSAISLTIGPRRMRGVLLNLKEELLAEEMVYIDQEGTNEYFLEKCIYIIKNLLKNKPKGCKFLGTGLSVIGRIDNEANTWVLSARWPKVDNLNFNEIKKSVRGPITVRRSVDSVLEYLIAHNDNYKKKNICLIYWGYSMMLSFSTNGNIVGSNLGRFGEMGHMKIAGTADAECECGNYGCGTSEGSSYGCLLIKASVKSLFPDIQKARGRTDVELYKLTDEEMFDFLKFPELIDIPSVANAACLVGVSLNTLFNIFYPDLILCTGPFLENERLFEKFRKQFYHGISKYDQEHVDLEVLVSGFDKGIYSNTFSFFKDKLDKMLIARF